MEELHGAGHLHLHAALQVLLALRVLDVVPGRAAASVAVSVGHQESVQILHLCPVLPDIVGLDGIRAVGIAGGQEGHHLAAVHALPGEVMVRELVPLIV